MALARTAMKMASYQSTQGFSTVKILPSRKGNLGIVELNNPSALNALDLKMVRAINAILSVWDEDETLKATLFIGRSGNDKNGKVRPAFCAGGDVKTIYQAGIDQSRDDKRPGYGVPGYVTSDFFREEYVMNHRVATQKASCPQISLWDGIVMGGGVGLSVHGKYRVATENTVFAMPETGIGLFPDVGGTYFLPRLEGGLGTYIALTGTKLKANDLLYAGIATHYVHSSKLENLQNELVKATSLKVLKDDAVIDVLSSFHEEIDPDSSHLAINRGGIDFAFMQKESMEDIIGALTKLSSWEKNTEFGSRTLSTLSRMSPSSLAITLEGLNRGAAMSDIAEDLAMEYRMVQGCMRTGSDFYEGVRALLVDKDNSPKWNPDSLDGLSRESVEKYFESLGEHELKLENPNNNGTEVTVSSRWKSKESDHSYDDRHPSSLRGGEESNGVEEKEDFISALVRMHPEAAAAPNGEGRFPVRLAIEGGNDGTRVWRRSSTPQGRVHGHASIHARRHHRR